MSSSIVLYFLQVNNVLKQYYREEKEGLLAKEYKVKGYLKRIVQSNAMQ